MQTRTSVPVRSLTAFAAILAAAPCSFALAQAAGTTQSVTPAASSAEVALQQASDLAAAGKLVRAMDLLTPLTGSAAGLSDTERDRAFSMLASLNTRLKSLDRVELSLQKADAALTSADIRSAEAHASAILKTADISSAQSKEANRILSAARAAREEMAPTIEGTLTQAVADFKAGQFVQAKAGLERVRKSGVELSAPSAAILDDYQTRIIDIEQQNGRPFETRLIAAAAFQPGVVKPKNQPSNNPAPAPAPSPAPEQPASETPAPAPAEQPPAQPAPSQPAPAPAPVVEKPAPAAPPSEDAVAATRRLSAQSLRAEADRDFGEGRFRTASRKYQDILDKYREFFSADDLRTIERRRDDAGLRAAGGQPTDDPVGQYVQTQTIARQQAVAEYNNQRGQAQQALQTGDVNRARDLAVTSRLTINNARNVFSEQEYENYQKEINDLLKRIDDESRAIADRERSETASSLAEQERRQREENLALKDRKIREAIARVRELQVQMDYEAALQIVRDQILVIDPINPAGLILRDILTDQLIYKDYTEVTRRKRLNNAYMVVENQEATLSPRGIIDYPSDWPKISTTRGEQLAFNDSPENNRVRALLATKRLPVSWPDVALQDAVKWVQTVTSLNVDVDWPSLEAIGITPDAPVTLNLTNVSMKTILDRMCEKVSPDDRSRAGWAINDGVLTIASEDVLRKNTPLVIYDIKDLIIQIPDYTNAPQFDLNSVLQSTGGGQRGGGGGGQSPFQSTNQGQGQGQFGGVPIRTKEDRIKDVTDIIQQNIDPDGWVDNGGTTGAINRLNDVLIIRNTPKNHQAIAGLLSKLRETRAMQINVETRFLLVSQDFFEQIGFDIDVYFNSKNNQVRTLRANGSPNATASDFFNSNGQLQRTTRLPGSTAETTLPIPRAGFSPIGVTQNSLSLTRNLISGDVDENSAAGIALGSAPALGIAGQFLDDVQVDFLIQATQADRRSVRLQAPRLTFTNGQISNIIVATQVAFVSDLTPVVSDSAVGFDPQLATVSEGVRLLVEGTVSADRRYVTMNVDTSTSKIDSFASYGVTAVAGGQLVNSADVEAFIQAPTITVTTVATTATVPDQGTILLGGQRIVNEFEAESGVPVLSKIPILNRFFSNRVKAKDEQTLLILMKPTILIQSEQEDTNFPGLADSLRGVGN